ncbi:MAG: AmmeMemoRadiSam system radical SAM enzyme [candidate division WOR-3 bacterium]|nr:AmmeMemoRadiSam system radical SAM enzyme [candidate division WOR-3 bacterium]
MSILVLFLLGSSLKEALFYKKLDNNKVQCELCFRKCIILENKRGFCRVRENRKGKLYSLVYNYPQAVQIDPTEKEPMYHFLPGTEILCIGTVGCNFVCQHCHNWHLSQASFKKGESYFLTPKEIVEIAKRKKIKSISFTYNEPTVFYEYLLDIAKESKKNNINIIWHSNGAINKEPLLALLEYTDGVTIDFKGINNEILMKMSNAKIDNTLQTLKIIKEKGKWLEIVNLLIPTLNDKEENIRDLCKWIKENLGDDLPLHFTRYFPNYKLTIPPTPISTLERAYKIAKEIGLKYVYLGNVPGHKYNSTYCPKCDKRLIYRIHFTVIENKIKNGKCSFCHTSIPGKWE